MKRRSFFHKNAFTLVELLIVLSLMSILALAIVPTLTLVGQRSKEHTLQTNLVILRKAIDAFKWSWEHDEIPKSLSLTGYPPSLTLLYEGIALSTGERKRFLTEIPRDPFEENDQIPNDQTWMLKGDQTGQSPPRSNEGIWDIHSHSIQIGLNGVPYAQW
jgi:general secretion pathway protein G